jgi:xylulokinase
MGPTPDERDPLALGIDLGTSGLRAALLDGRGRLVHTAATTYPGRFEEPHSWLEGVTRLLQGLPGPLRTRISAVAVDGTSGTLLLCDRHGVPLGPALPYHQSCPEQQSRLRSLIGGDGPAGSVSGSLARALRLLEHRSPPDAHQGSLRLRHQADWLTGWLLEDWRWGEEGNNLRLGWDPMAAAWRAGLEAWPWLSALPEVVPSGSVLGPLAEMARQQLGLPAECLVVSGTTDANAAVLAAEPRPGDGVTVLGSTLVLKCFVARPLQGPGITMHRLDGRWLAGGASNAGAAILRRELPDSDLQELSRQIDPDRPTGLDLLPLNGPGERFPVDDPDLAPRLTPRPVSDTTYLQALLEGLARIEARGWRRLQELGAPPLRRVITLGGGARNPQWRMLRQRLLQVPVLNRPSLQPSAGVATLALRALRSRRTLLPMPHSR